MPHTGAGKGPKKSNNADMSEVFPCMLKSEVSA
jgi:hypothetical protein